MIDYQKWLDVLKEGKYGSNVLTLYQILDINKLLVMMEQRNNLNDIAEQVAMARLMVAEKIDAYSDTLIEVGKMLPEIVHNFMENEMSGKDKSGDGVTTDTAATQEKAETATMALLIQKINEFQQRCFDAENKIAGLEGNQAAMQTRISALETNQEALDGKVIAMTRG